jgi:Protein of unknown function (DUF2009)
VPNALVFLQKYVQIPWMLAPILQCIDYLDHLTSVAASIGHANADASATSTASAAAAAAASSDVAPVLNGHNCSSSSSSSGSRQSPTQQQQHAEQANSANDDVKAATTSASANSSGSSVDIQHGDIEAVAYISERWESPKRLKQHILRDFFKFSFDGKTLCSVQKLLRYCKYSKYRIHDFQIQFFDSTATLVVLLQRVNNVVTLHCTLTI